METRLKKWRSGIEAAISNLKRGFDLRVCNWKGFKHLKQRWCGVCGLQHPGNHKYDFVPNSRACVKKIVEIEFYIVPIWLMCQIDWYYVCYIDLLEPQKAIFQKKVSKNNSFET